MSEQVRIAFFGSSLVSSYWNGAATYYRGLLQALAQRGHQIVFYEPDAFGRQQRRDIDDPDWARVVVYPPTEEAAARMLEAAAEEADVIVKASGVGVLDAWLEREVAGLRGTGPLVLFWDVDAPATLERLAEDPADPFHACVPRFDMVLTYGGGPRVIAAYEALGAAACIPIYNGLDPALHHRVEPDPAFAADLGFLANRLPDREARVNTFFFDAARAAPDARFLLGGSGWDADPPSIPPNVRTLGHVPTRDHNAFNASTRMVLNVNRDSMARFGWSPATRVFEAVGAGACLIVDAWEGIEDFFEPGREVLVAHDGHEVAELLQSVGAQQAAGIGERARVRALREHTYARRALDVEHALSGRAVVA